MSNTIKISDLTSGCIAARSPIRTLPGNCQIKGNGRFLKGYPVVQTGPREFSMAARVLWELERGPIEPGLKIMHVCTNRACMNVDHMRAATGSEVMAYRTQTGNYRPPTKGYRQFKEAEVRQIWEMIKVGHRTVDIARLYGCTPANISMIRNGRSWTSVTGL